MKKLVLSLTMLAFAGIAYAQPSSGSIYFGGGLNFSTYSDKSEKGTTTTDGESNTSFGISPRAGYFLTDKISVGLSLGYNSSTTKQDLGNNNSTESVETSFNLTPFARYHMFTNDKFAFFGEAQIRIASGNTKNSITNGNTTTSTEFPTSNLRIGILPGIQYFMNDHMSIEATYGFLGYESESNGTTDNNGTKNTRSTPFNLNVNTSTLTFGFNYYL